MREDTRAVEEAMLVRDDERDCRGSGGGSGSCTWAAGFAREPSEAEAEERRRASRAETGRTTPSAFRPRREKRGAAAWVIQFSSGLRDVEGIALPGDPLRESAWNTLLREPVERALGVGELGRECLGLGDP